MENKGLSYYYLRKQKKNLCSQFEVVNPTTKSGVGFRPY